jgi:hypothetical protein
MKSYGYKYHEDGLLVKLKVYDMSAMEFTSFTKATHFLILMIPFIVVKEIFFTRLSKIGKFNFIPSRCEIDE